MTSGLSLRPLTAETRPILERLWQLYRHDLSEFRGMLPDEKGAFHTRTLAPFLNDHSDRSAYIFHLATGPVGFGLVSRVTSEPHLMSEFFVARGARGQGIGRAAADALFVLHPGAWEIPFQENNVAAARFWRSVAVDRAGPGYQEELRPVPDKPHIPPDVWITITAG